MAMAGGGMIASRARGMLFGLDVVAVANLDELHMSEFRLMF